MNSNGQNPTPNQLSGRGIVLVEASLGGPSRGDYESMERRRYQKPARRREGQQWVLYYWDDEFVQGERRRKKKRHVLGPANLLEREAQKVRDEFPFCEMLRASALLSAATSGTVVSSVRRNREPR